MLLVMSYLAMVLVSFSIDKLMDLKVLTLILSQMSLFSLATKKEKFGIPSLEPFLQVMKNVEQILLGFIYALFQKSILFSDLRNQKLIKCFGLMS
jgi:hypothetical protein